MQNQIKITCTGAAEAPLEAFTAFQGELKTLPPAHYEALKAQMLEHGFSFSLHVWEYQGHRYLLDGHQRVRVLQRLKEEGYAIPDLPYSIVQATSIQQAKEKLLAAASQYGETTPMGLAKFISEIEMDPLKLSNFPLPKIDMPKFIEGHFKDATGVETEEGDASGFITGTQVTREEAENGPVSHVRMVQVFLNDDTFPDFMEKVIALQQKYGCDNVSDAILEAIRAHYLSIFPAE